MNVLIVDDQPEVVESMVTGVNWKKIPVEQVFTAYSVKEAQSVFERERIDVLLCDIEMPPTNGFALLRWAQERFSGVVCIFLSAHAEFEYAQEAVKLGSFDYILQPAPYAEIEAAVERAAGKVREAENQRRYNAYAKYRGEDESAEKEPDKTEQTPIQRAMTYIRRNIDKDLSRAEIADAIYLNPEYLSRLFKKETGDTIFSTLSHIRIRNAKKYLATGLYTCNEVATKCGFHDAYYFSKVFKKLAGCTPTEYRKNMN